MKNFLVPVDFSEASQNAARYAISLGEVLKAKIIFINVVPIGLLIEDESLHSRIAAQAQLVESNKDFLSKEIIALSKNHSVSTEGYVAEGPVPEMILQMAHEHQSDLISMVSHSNFLEQVVVGTYHRSSKSGRHGRNIND